MSRENFRFKAVYYSITLVCLGVAALALYNAYQSLHIRRLYWAGLGAALLLYILIVLLALRKQRGFRKALCHTIALQILPLSAAIFVFCNLPERDNYRPLGGTANSYEKTFNDLQKTQKAAALKNGLPPFKSRTALEKECQALCQGNRLVKISSNDKYIVRDLTHSVPYVVPKVDTLLNDIAVSFQEKTGSKARFVVTSVLRTEEDVKKLQKVNGNATSSSCHCNATTVDISYVRFGQDNKRRRNEHDLRLALAKSLYELREADRCYVKIEKKQHCYHITVR